MNAWNRRAVVLGAIALVIVLAACAAADSSVGVSETGGVPLSTRTPRPTRTPAATRTQLPTLTPRATNTPRPTAVPTPVPEPIILRGEGDAVVDMVKWSGPALAHITYGGSRNFIVENYGADGERIDLLVNVIGRYEGTRPLDFLEDEHSTRFQVESSGAWEIEVLPLSEIRQERVPGAFSGTGDEALILTGGTPDLLKIDATAAKSNFAIWGYGDRRRLLVNEIAPYDGTVIAGKDTVVLVVEAEGPWTIEVTAR